MQERLALPQIGQIIQSPTELAAREQAPVYIRRMGNDDDVPNAGLFAPQVFATTETATLQEYDSNLRRLGELMRQIPGDETPNHDPRKLSLLHKRLGYVGMPELNRGVEWMADVLAARLQQQEEVFVAVTTYKSSSYIYGLAAARLRQTDSEAAKRIVPFDIDVFKRFGANMQVRARMDAAGICFPDDRLVRGTQMSNTVINLQMYHGIKPEIMDVLVIASPTDHLIRGLDGSIPCRSLYEDKQPGDHCASVAQTAAHSPVDNGFKDILHAYYNGMRRQLHEHYGEERPRLPLPYLAGIEPVYRQTPIPHSHRTGDFSAYNRARLSYNKTLKQLVNIAEL